MHPVAVAELPARLKTLFELWQGHCGALRFPAPERLDPAALQPWSREMHLVELLDDGDLLFHRFSPVSTRRLGYDMTGRRLSSVATDERVIARTGSYRRCLILARPLAEFMPGAACGSNAGSDSSAYHRLLLPLGSGPQPHMLVVALAFGADEAAGDDAIRDGAV